MADAATPTPIGDYFAALDRGDGRGAAETFAEAAVVRLPSDEETGPRRVLSGDEITTMLLARHAPTWSHHLSKVISTGHVTVVEGEIGDATSSAVLGTFLASIELSVEGSITVYDAFRRPGAARPFTRSDDEAPNARAMLTSLCDATVAGPMVEVDLVDESSVWLPNHPAHLRAPGRLVPLLPAMEPSNVLVSGTTAVALGTAAHPHSRQRTVDFALSVTLDQPARIDRLVLYWTRARRLR